MMGDMVSAKETETEALSRSPSQCRFRGGNVPVNDVHVFVMFNRLVPGFGGRLEGFEENITLETHAAERATDLAV